MKSFTQILIAALLLLTFFRVNAQLAETDRRKFIEVTGSAEASIQPDEIELEVVLAEHNKQSIDKAEENFYAVLEAHSIPKEAVTLQSQLNWWYWWSYYRDQHQTRSIKLKLGSTVNLMKLAGDLQAGWVQSTRVVNWSSSGSQRLRREVKIGAIRAAKDKANDLLEAVGEKLGGILSVNELQENNYGYWYYNQHALSNVSVSPGYESSQPIANAGEIKLRYEVKVKFEIR